MAVTTLIPNPLSHKGTPSHSVLVVSGLRFCMLAPLNEVVGKLRRGLTEQRVQSLSPFCVNIAESLSKRAPPPPKPPRQTAVLVPSGTAWRWGSGAAEGRVGPVALDAVVACVSLPELTPPWPPHWPPPSSGS